MTDIDMSTGTNMEYFIYLITFWVVLVGGFLFVHYYVWPIVERMYWRTAVALHHAIRQFIINTRGHNRSYYTGYKGGSK